MKVVGMDPEEGIVWDRIIVGISPYLEEKGMAVKRDDNNLPLFPIDDGKEPKKKIIAGSKRDRWTKGQRGGGSNQVVKNMSKVLAAVKNSFLKREKDLKGGKVVTFNPDYDTQGP
jgi:hypothetical protein